MSWVVLWVLLLCAALASRAQDPDMVRYVAEGDAAAARGDVEVALQAYAKAQAAGAGSAAFLFRLGTLHLQARHYDKALESLRLSLKEKPGQLPVYSRIGEVFVAMGRLDSAIHSVQEAAALAPGTASIHTSLAYLYLESDSLAPARAHLDTALRLEPTSAEAHRYMGYYLSRQDSVAEAIKHYRRVTELVPEHFEAYNNMGFLLAQQGQYAQALEQYRMAKERAQEPALVHAINGRMQAVEAVMQGKMRARYIIVDSQAEAAELLRRVRDGEDFEELARRHSLAPNAEDGGDAGYFGPGELLPAFEETVVSLEIGQVSEVVRVSTGYMLIQRLN
ncbi:MAG: tetratricopeptide repeat protein [Candidatus Latescibacterota bacterium]